MKEKKQKANNNKVNCKQDVTKFIRRMRICLHTSRKSWRGIKPACTPMLTNAEDIQNKPTIIS